MLGIEFSGSYLHHEAQPGFCVKSVKPVQASSLGFMDWYLRRRLRSCIRSLVLCSGGTIGVLLSGFLVEYT